MRSKPKMWGLASRTPAACATEKSGTYDTSAPSTRAMRRGRRLLRRRLLVRLRLMRLRLLRRRLLVRLRRRLLVRK